ncbi:hypothetical protein K474DRAFT_1563813, partial [Panus rudis PR-1116 ss-1]
SDDADLRGQMYPVYVDFVPVSFNPDEQQDVATFEECNGLPQGSIEDARWVKPVEKRNPGQSVATLLIEFNQASTANDAIKTGLVIHGKSVSVRKRVPEPLRCAKCHKYSGHFAAKCKAEADLCGYCRKEGHRSSDCTRRNDKAAACCANCGGNHPVWFPECPVYHEARELLFTRSPEASHQFYLT